MKAPGFALNENQFTFIGANEHTNLTNSLAAVKTIVLRNAMIRARLAQERAYAPGFGKNNRRLSLASLEYYGDLVAVSIPNHRYHPRLELGDSITKAFLEHAPPERRNKWQKEWSHLDEQASAYAFWMPVTYRIWPALTALAYNSLTKPSASMSPLLSAFSTFLTRLGNIHDGDRPDNWMEYLVDLAISELHMTGGELKTKLLLPSEHAATFAQMEVHPW